MKETISSLRKLIIRNNIKSALDQLFELTERNNQYEYLLDEIILLQSTNAMLLEREKDYAHLPEYKQLIKEVLAILSKLKPESQSNLRFSQNENVGRNIKVIKPHIDESHDKNIPKVAYLLPNPIDKNFGFNFDQIKKYLRNDKVHVDCFYLNMETIQNLEGYDYVIIRSEVFKEKIYIEGENLQSQVISIFDLEENILSKLKCLIIIAEGTVDLKGVESPLVHIKNPKSIDSFIFKFFKQCEKEKIQGEDYEIRNKDDIQTLKLEKGKFILNYPSCTLPKELDRKILQSFVGRTLDQEKLIAKIIQLPYSGKVLTVKGSGGSGKTTIVSKIAIELAQRNFFKEGLGFIACEHITDYKSFEAKMAICFDFDNIVNFAEHIRQYNRFDKLIILDNFETLLNLEDQKEIFQIKELIGLVSDYASIVLTSREIINFEFEDILTLDRLPTDEALLLFIKAAGIEKIDDTEKKILREDIIENLLANNPLAIKIIASPSILPKGKRMEKLKEELEKDFFSATTIELSDVFNSDTDTNVERKRSIYQSINYSYSKLSPIEKLAFELLHLFPDGINISNFEECFKKQKSETTIKERHLAALEGKSLIELSQGVAKLQSIVGRFAKHQFIRRNSKQKANYFKDAYNYNGFILELVRRISYEKSYELALAITDGQINNLLYTLSYMTQLKLNSADKKYLLNYINYLISYITTESALEKYRISINEITFFFEDIPQSKLLFQVAEIVLLYYKRTFEPTFKKLNEILPLEQISLLDFQDEIEINYITNAMRIYSFEGYTLECLKLYHLNNLHEDWVIDYMLFYIGDYRHSKGHNKFYEFETLLNQKKLFIEEIESFITQIFHRNHLNKMQISYTLSKMKPLEWEYIEKLVITNPYTKGLKNLMFAFNTTEGNDEITDYYKKAIECLEHIKYYYVEAIFYYAKHLQKTNNDQYKEQYIKGLELAKKYQFRFLIHEFIDLEKGVSTLYLAENYPLNVDFDFEDFIQKYAENQVDNKENHLNSRPKIKTLSSPVSNKPPGKPALFVEGPTDKTALQEAIRIFNPTLASKFEIICELDERKHYRNKNGNGGGVNWVQSRMQGWITNKWFVKAACILDNDSEANRVKHEINKEINNVKSDTLKKLYKVFPIGCNTSIKNLLQENIIIPYALEEMFPANCWEYAEKQGWLNDRDSLEGIIQKAKDYTPLTQNILDYLNSKNLSTNLYLIKQVNMFKKEDFINYIMTLPNKEIIFAEFKPLLENLDRFFK